MWVKLGTTLVREGLITSAQLSEALRIQETEGRRLGTILVERNMIPVDLLSTWLGRISGFPCVTAKMLADARRDVLDLLPGDLARRLQCIPFRRDIGSLHVAVVNPYSSEAAEALASRARLPMLKFVVPEILFYRFLEKHYGITADPGVAGAKPPEVPSRAEPPQPAVGAVPRLRLVSSQSAEAIAAPAAPISRPPAAPRPVIARTSVEAIAPPTAPAEPKRPSSAPSAPAAAVPLDTQVPPLPPQPPARPLATSEAAPVVVATPLAPPPPESPAGSPILSAKAAIDAAQRRARIADVLLQYALSIFDAALLLTVRDHVATGWTGRGAGLSDIEVGQIALSLNIPSLFREAHEKRLPAGGPVAENAVHQRFFKVLGRTPPVSAVVVPLVLDERVRMLLYADRVAAPDALRAADGLITLASHAAMALARVRGDQRQQAS
jgi:hypothetical protein